MDNSYIVVILYKRASKDSYNKIHCQVYADNEYTAVARACRIFGEMNEEIEDAIVVSVNEE